MSYYIHKQVTTGFEATIGAVTEALKKEGFGILTEIDVKATLKKKLDVDFRNYRILGACNPPFAYQALQAEEYIGALLPCNVIVEEGKDGAVHVAAIDPLVSMQAVNNPALQGIAQEVRGHLERVVNSL
jgi:uncharacterized protein (DUF302 family)